MLTQIAPPTRENVEAYTDIRQQLESLAGSINGRFGELDWVPIHYIHRSTPRRRLADIYRASRIGMVTPLRDGMNLVAKEYVAAQDPADPGVLILSQFAGAAEEMTEALIVNPYNIEETADIIKHCPGDASRGAAGSIQRVDGIRANVRRGHLGEIVPGATRAGAQHGCRVRDASADPRRPGEAAPVERAAAAQDQAFVCARPYRVGIGRRWRMSSPAFQFMNSLVVGMDRRGARFSDPRRPSLPAHVYVYAMSTAESIEDTRPGPEQGADEPFTLGVDIGGTNLKASVMDRQGRLVAEQVRMPTPKPATPKTVLKAIEDLAGRLPSFNRISVGFPAWSRAARRSRLPTSGRSIGRASS